MSRLIVFRCLLFAMFYVAIGGCVTPASAQTTEKSVVITEQVRAELLAHAPQGVPTGPAGASQPVWLGLQITHQPGWHTYWKNSGDSGLPTQLEWTLPVGVMAGDIAWPLPKKIPIGHLANFGYEDTVLLPVPLIVTPEFKPPMPGQALPVKLRASWLVCRQECIPQEGEFALALPLRSSTALHAAAFDKSLAAQPAALPGAHQIELKDDGRRLTVRIAGLPAGVQGRPLQLFPETSNVLVSAMQAAAAGEALGPKTWRQAWDGAVWTADVPVSDQRADSPASMPLVLVTDDGAQGWRAEVPVTGAWPAIVPLAVVSPALESALKANAAPASATPPRASGMTPAPAATFLLALAGALIGGMVLNLMPCVFPVLAIKVLGFARHADDRRAHRVSGLAYTAGVVLSFLALGGLMLALRSAGEAVGWGFQLQSPAVVAALAMLFTVIGLNLAGVFEIGAMLPSRLASLQARHPAADAVLSGMLAVAVASPCTAPFMGASLGLAVGLPAWQALAVFAVIGLGMALPYLAASVWPAVARLLPKPGAWMLVFKQFMAFPMFATVAWLLWVLGQQSGVNGAGALLALLVALAMLLWALGLAGRMRVVVTMVSIIALALLFGAVGRHVVTPIDTAEAPQALRGDARWQAWSTQRTQQLVAAGTPVFVDFTAAWCVTCQYNKSTVLSNAEVLAAFDAAKVQTLRADWTRRDAAITAELQRLGRSGVPVYVLQAPGRPPLVFSEVLSVSEVKAALARL